MSVSAPANGNEDMGSSVSQHRRPADNIQGQGGLETRIHIRQQWQACEVLGGVCLGRHHHLVRESINTVTTTLLD